MTTYIPAAPCGRCGTSLRYFSNNGCAECLRRSSRAYYRKNAETLKPKKRQWFKDNLERHRERVLEWQRNNRDKAALTQRKARHARPDHYRAKGRYYAALRRSATLRATPPWADLNAIESFYRACPAGMEVDHIVPLRGELVCGLHVHWNFQYLTKCANSAKGNKHADLG